MRTVLRWVGAAFGLLVFLMLVMIGVGTTLPINHVATCGAQLPVAQHTVWQTIANPLDYAWRSDIADAQLYSPPPGSASLPDRTLGARSHPGMEWMETDHYGHSIIYQRVSAEPDHHLVNRIADPAAPFGGTWTYDLTPAPAIHGTTVSIVENGEIYNPVFRFLARFFVGYTGTMRTHLTDLAKKFGATVTVSCVTPSGVGRR